MSTENNAPPLTQPTFSKVSSLKPMSTGHNLILKVVSTKVVIEKNKDKKEMISEAVVGDETGTIILTVKNEQNDVVQPGNTIILRNGIIKVFNGFMRLYVNIWGNIKLSPTPSDFVVNNSNDLSAIEYELKRT
ncbi:hypothetical protein ACTFIW_006516 [Dictyostelium discoideum]|uniref:Single-stranded DNA binding protein Ssb-like OB fold domain-containing protein n=1 Tax=Dictyostelium discoideum TaxID=44689 RepID=Q54X50_DICDI|nr:hypothetical protein DDB_G0279209 [Dictyostelium discoideum AX4]EAL67753.1 hypothetical protein DDB_G0279209 [Dictyostelium discoideum AX4]|eukprot:XP_641727.1 hypothetical protein DDB_G0279209 [Dictyostelium discoideum AX4]